MHEFSIVEALLEQVQSIASDNHLQKVTQVKIEDGSLRLVVPELMETAFNAAAASTVADGARLDVIEKKALARCRACRESFSPVVHDFRCPRCSDTDVEILSGNDIILLTLNGIPKDGTQDEG